MRSMQLALLALGLFFGSAGNAATGDDDEGTFDDVTVKATAPLSKVKRPICPPGTKEEICRCVVVSASIDELGYRKIDYVVSENAPKFCSDALLVAVFKIPEADYLPIVHRIASENKYYPE